MFLSSYKNLHEREITRRSTLVSQTSTRDSKFHRWFRIRRKCVQFLKGSFINFYHSCNEAVLFCFPSVFSVSVLF